MADKESTYEAITSAFAGSTYPGDEFLIGSREGREPFDEIAPFRGRSNWKELDAEFLDEHAVALHFFSEGGLRFFLPAFLVADLRGELRVADPLFTLTDGFSDTAVEIRVKGREFLIKTGKSQFINPKRYGAITFFDYARYRLSVFTRDETSAIVAYLEFKRHSDDVQKLQKERTDTALDSFWRERAESAPEVKDLQSYLQEQAEYLRAVTAT